MDAIGVGVSGRGGGAAGVTRASFSKKQKDLLQYPDLKFLEKNKKGFLICPYINSKSFSGRIVPISK